MSFIELVQVFNQYKELIEFFNENYQKGGLAIIPTISFTGGEPFYRDDFLELLELFTTHVSTIEMSILSNGTLITSDIAEKLKSFNISKVQVSIDGDEATHDDIRGQGSFKKAEAGIKSLLDAGVNTTISFTAHKGNYKILPEVVKIARNWNVNSIWSDRVIPEGSGSELLLMSKDETKEYIELLGKLAGENIVSESCACKVHNRRALQFLANSEQNAPYYCKAGKNLLTVMHNGDVYVCRRMPILLGNLREQTLKDIYCNHEILKDLRQERTIKGCEKCEHKTVCRGGLKCLAYAVNGDYNTADPGCWLANL